MFALWMFCLKPESKYENVTPNSRMSSLDPGLPGQQVKDTVPKDGILVNDNKRRSILWGK